MCLPKHGLRFPADQGVLVALPQVGHEDVRVPAAGYDLGEGLVGLERPDSLLMTRVRGYTPLLAQGPELDGPVTRAAQTLGPVPVQHQRLHIVAVTLELHQLAAGSRIPDSQHLNFIKIIFEMLYAKLREFRERAKS